MSFSSWLHSNPGTLCTNLCIGEIEDKRFQVTMNFEWNLQKAEINFKKHSIGFEEAKTVFDDPLYIDFYDPDHSDNEHRYLIIGQSS